MKPGTHNDHCEGQHMQVRQQDSTATTTVTALGETATAGPWALTVTEVVSGDEAASRVAETNSGNPEAPTGLIYLLAHVRAENTGDATAILNLADFAATGTDGILRRAVSMAVPDPALQGTADAGGVLEGWIPLVVDDAAAATLLYDSAVLAGNWANAVLALADGAALPQFSPDAAPDENAGSDPGAPAVLNQAVRAGDWAVTILKTDQGQAIYEMSDYRLRALGDSGDDVSTWYGVYAHVTNFGAHPAFFSPNALELVDETGEPWNSIMALTAPDPDLSREVLPGASREGWTVFQLRPFVANLMVRVMPSVVADAPRYVTLDGGAGQTAAPTRESTEAKPLGVAVGDTVTVNDSPVNLRKEPKADGEIVAELQKGTELAITGEPVEADGYRWYPVTVSESGDAGYVVQDYITAAGN